jgi:hypothetical protein
VAETIRALEQLKNAGHLSDEEHVSRRNSVLDEWLSGKVSSRR